LKLGMAISFDLNIFGKSFVEWNTFNILNKKKYLFLHG